VVAKRHEHDLKGRQPLLSIDDVDHREFISELRQAPEDDRPQEVPPNVLGPGGARENFVGFSANVVPKWLPLLLHIPDVLPLEYRNNELEIHLEQLRNSHFCRIQVDLVWQASKAAGYHREAVGTAAQRWNSRTQHGIVQRAGRASVRGTGTLFGLTT